MLSNIPIWAWAPMAVCAVAWGAAIVTVVRRRKFLRKALWILLCFVTFSIRWPLAPGETLTVGAPLGALYVLGFARWGMTPTPEEIAAAHANARPVVAPADQVRLLHAAYGLFAAAFAIQMGWVVFGPALQAFTPPGADIDTLLPGFRNSMLVFGLAMFAFQVFLAVRPYPWAKLVCALAAVAWTGHGVMSFFLLPHVAPPGYPVGLHAAITSGSGLVAAACGLLHLRIDPRLGGTYLRAA